MATVTGLTAAKMQEIVDGIVVGGHITGDDLILVTTDLTEINAGNVRGPMGPSGAGYEIVEFDDLPTDLVLGDAGKAYYDPVTGILYTWNGTRYVVQDRIICTSTTRPTLGIDDGGTKIYETDTTLEYIWNGTSYVLETGPPVGTAYHTILDTAPVNHILMFGQTIPDADSEYPVLWANLPAAWKNGTSLVVPDGRGRVFAGKDDMGGFAANRLTSGVSGIAGTTLGAVGGDQRVQQHTHIQNSHYHTRESPSSYYFPVNNTVETTLVSAGYTTVNTGSTTAINQNYGSGNSQNVQPSIILNSILKVL